MIYVNANKIKYLKDCREEDMMRLYENVGGGTRLWWIERPEEEKIKSIRRAMEQGSDKAFRFELYKKKGGE